MASPYLRRGGEKLSRQAKEGVVPIPKTDSKRKKRTPSVRTESTRGSKRVEQSRPKRETR